MNGKSGDDTPPFGMMPPAVTQQNGDRPDARTDARMAPPFVGGPAHVPQFHAAEPAEALSAAGAHHEEDIMPWDPMEDEGVVEPVFQADTEDVLAQLSKQAQKEEFPMDAFIIPEQTQRVPTGLEGKPRTADPEHTPLSNLADRLEKLSHRLRVEDTQVVVRRLAGGDKLDALLAGLLAGYLAGSE